MKIPKQSAPVLRLPSPVKSSVGLGDVVKSATRRLGFEPCGACRRRAETLNRWVTLAPWKGSG